MEKKLPKVFQNNIEKNLSNNKKVYYSDSKDRSDLPQNDNNDINQKVNNIFASPKYVYKANTIIKLKSGTVKKTVIGKQNNNLLTIENELIPINEILDINIE